VFYRSPEFGIVPSSMEITAAPEPTRTYAAALGLRREGAQEVYDAGSPSSFTIQPPSLAEFAPIHGGNPFLPQGAPSTDAGRDTQGNKRQRILGFRAEDPGDMTHEELVRALEHKTAEAGPGQKAIFDALLKALNAAGVPSSQVPADAELKLGPEYEERTTNALKLYSDRLAGFVSLHDQLERLGEMKTKGEYPKSFNITIPSYVSKDFEAIAKTVNDTCKSQVLPQLQAFLMDEWTKAKHAEIQAHKEFLDKAQGWFEESLDDIAHRSLNYPTREVVSTLTADHACLEAGGPDPRGTGVKEVVALQELRITRREKLRGREGCREQPPSSRPWTLRLNSQPLFCSAERPGEREQGHEATSHTA